MKPAMAEVAQAGEEACRGKTPVEVKAEFFGDAEANLAPQQIKLIERIADFEAQAGGGQSFSAGQLAADVYAATLPDDVARAGFQGCVYALAQGRR